MQEFTPDANGNMIARSTALSSDGNQALVRQSINGQSVPLDQTESKTLRETATEKVTEQIVHHYGPGGEILSTDRTVTEEHKRPDGGAFVESTIQHSDLSGGMREVERRATNTSVQGKTSTTDLTISRIGLDGHLAPEEKHKTVKTGDEKVTHEEEEVFKVSTNGSFTPSARNVTDKTVSGEKTTSQTAHYETDYQGRSQLDNLKVTNTAKSSDGRQVTEVNTYGYPPGQSRGDTPLQAIQSQQVIERTPRPDGTVAETLSVRLPSLSDSGRLGPANLISQKVCSGKCDDTKP